MIKYVPQILEYPSKVQTAKSTAWKANAYIVKDITSRFVRNPNLFLEFGVEYGFSTSVFSSYYNKVIGVDTFEGDVHSGLKSGMFEETTALLREYPNIELVRSNYQDYILNNNNSYDAIHVDIIHTYEDTYKCGKWSVEHSDVVMFHDTVSFDSVKMACNDLAVQYNLTFYNYDVEYGLGILVRSL